MILKIFALAFVLGIMFVNSMFGLYSGLINVFCVIVALAVAFGYLEVVNDLLTAQGLHPGYTEPFTLVLLFVVTLVILRVLADKFLRGNVKVPMYADWAGGAVCGFVIAEVCVGVMVLGFLMLPHGGRAAMFSRYEREADNEIDVDTQRVIFQRNDLWLKPDQFTVGLFNLLSHGSLKGETTFDSIYPDFPEWVFWSGNTVQHESLAAPIRDKDGDGFKNGISVVTWWRQAGPIQGRYRKEAPREERTNPPFSDMTYTPQAGNELIGVRLQLKRATADRGAKKTSARYHRFRPAMFRLVGDVGGGDTAQPRQYAAQIVGSDDPRVEGQLRISDYDANFSMAAGGDTQVDLYFEVDQEFEPRFVEYRRHARQALEEAEFSETPPAERLAASAGGGAAAPSGSGARSSGPGRFVDAIVDGHTGERDQLPFRMSATAVAGGQVETSGNMLAEGRLSGQVADLRGSPTGGRIEKFEVPGDRRMFQVRFKTRAAASLAGQVFNFVGATVNQYQAVSNSGERFDLVGYYAIVKRNGEDFIELRYAPDDPSFRKMLDFQDSNIKRDLRRQDDAELGLVFLVSPGACITGVRSNGGQTEFGREYCVSR